MALILFVLVLLAYVQNLMNSQRLAALQGQIASSERQLGTLQAQIDEQKARLQASDEKVRTQQAVVAASAAQLDALRSQLQAAAVLRMDVLDKLKHALESELGAVGDGGAPLVTIGDNGNIVINESLVFESDSYAIKPQAKPLLASLATALGRILADENVRQNIDTILIQGHTDRRGSVAFNWDLSAKRATAVLNTLFASDPSLAESYGSYFAAAAYSKFRPIDSADDEAAYQKNRRIEIALIPKDSNVRKVIDDYVRGVDPTLKPPASN